MSPRYEVSCWPPHMLRVTVEAENEDEAIALGDEELWAASSILEGATWEVRELDGDDDAA